MELGAMMGGMASTAFTATVSVAGGTITVPSLAAIAIGGAAAGLVSTGSLKGALIGAASAPAFYGVGELFAKGGLFATIGKDIVGQAGKAAVAVKHAVKTVFHGAVGGLRSVVSGGKFAAGFLSAGFAQAFSPVIGYAGEIAGAAKDVVVITAAGVIGGAGSVLVGGKFVDGMITGAFSLRLNDWFHGYTEKALADPYSGVDVNPNDMNTKSLLFQNSVGLALLQVPVE
jgi:hypothetical protein